MIKIGVDKKTDDFHMDVRDFVEKKFEYKKINE
jgi:hypothetical protein